MQDEKVTSVELVIKQIFYITKKKKMGYAPDLV